MSDIRFNQWLHQSGTGGVSQSDGGHVGIGTTNPLIPVGAGNTHILNVGVVTANTYYGDGSNLSGIDGSALKFGGAVKAQANAAGVVVTGILTATGNLHADNAFLNSGLTLNNNANVSVNLTSTSTSGSSRIFFGDPDNSLVGRLLYSHNGDYMSFYTAGAERARILSGGEFAIGGTGYAGQPFSVQTSGNNLGYMQSTGTTRAVMNFRDGNSSQNIGFGCIGNNHVFMKDGSEKVRIDSSGRILVGTGAIANPKSSGAGSIDLDNHAFTIIVGGNHPSGGRTDNNAKTFRMSMVHNTLAEEPINILQGYCDSSDNNLYIGGGTGSANSLTQVRVYTGTNTTTTGGTERIRVNNAGAIGLSGANYGSSGQVLTSQGSSSAVQWASVAAGSVFDTWHGQGFSGSAGNGYITSGWGRPGGPGGSWANGGSGKQTSQSSGIFSFPSTGIYYVSFQLGGYAQNVNNRIIGNRIYATNNNSNPPPHEVAHGQFNVKSFSGIDNGVGYGLAICECILKITNTSNDKVAFWWQSEDNYNLGAGTDQMAIFYKLADL